MFSSRSGIGRTPNSVARALEQARRTGRPLLDLTESNPTRASLPYPTESLLDALAPPESLGYEPHPLGLPSARAAVAREVGAETGQVVLTASTSEAYALLFKLLCDPGDEILVPQPSYPLLELLTHLDGIRLTPYFLRYDGSWHVDLESVHAAIGPRTRAIVIVHPNNPTGSFLSSTEIASLLDTGLPLISDEVFASYSLQGHPPEVPSVADHVAGKVADPDGQLVFALGGLSKHAGLPQLKLGWLVASGDPRTRDEALARLELLADAYLSVATPVQHAAPALLRQGAAIRDAIRNRITHNLAHVRDALSPATGSAATLLPAQGGWYAVVRLPRTRSEEQWALDLLDTGVVVHPGFLYDFPDEAYVVVSLLTPPDTFQQGIAQLRAAID